MQVGERGGGEQKSKIQKNSEIKQVNMPNRHKKKKHKNLKRTRSGRRGGVGGGVQWSYWRMLMPEEVTVPSCWWAGFACVSCVWMWVHCCNENEVKVCVEVYTGVLYFPFKVFLFLFCLQSTGNVYRRRPESVCVRACVLWVRACVRACVWVRACVRVSLASDS